MAVNTEGRPRFPFHKDRDISVESVNPEVLAWKEAVVSQGMTEEVFDNINSLIGKATDLLDAVRPAAKPFVPVYEDALEVRLAIRGLYPGESEDRITFEQYMAALDYTENRTNLDPIKLDAELTGDPRVDSRIIYRSMSKQSDGEAWKELAVMGGQFALLAIANRMLQTFQAPNTQVAVAGKMPASTELGATLAQFAIGLAAILVQAATNRKEVESFLEESFGSALAEWNIDPAGAVDQASAVEDPVVDRYRKSQRAGYVETMYDYALNYAARSPDPGYESWVAAGEVHSIREDLRLSGTEGKGYLATAGSLVSAPYQMTKDIYKLLTCKVTGANDRLNKMAAVMTSKYTKDLICCFVRILGAIPTRYLEMFRTFLSFSAKGASTDLAAALGPLMTNFNVRLEEKVLEPILHQVNAFFQSYVRDILDFMDPGTKENSEEWETLLICTPIEEMMHYVLMAIEKLRAVMVKYIREYWDKLSVKNHGGSLRIELLAEHRKAAVLLRLVDSVLEAVKRGNLCATGDQTTPSPEDVEDIVTNFTEGLPTPITVELDGDPYKTFASRDLEQFTTASGLLVMHKLVPEGTRGAPDDCARAQINDKTLAVFMERVDRLTRERRDAGIEPG